MKRLLISLTVFAALVAPAAAVDENTLFGAAVTQWVQTNCDNADEFPKNLFEMAPMILKMASPEEVKAVRKQVRETAKSAGDDEQLYCVAIMMTFKK